MLIPKPGLTLYHYYRSSCSWRVRWALKIKNVGFNAVPINLLKKEQESQAFMKRNPNGFVPCLEIDNEFFSESIAILEWLDETYKEPPLLPQDPISRLRVRQLAFTIASGVQPLQNLLAQKIHSSDRKKQLEYACFWIEKGFNAYERLLLAAKGTYSFESQLSIADLCLIPQCYNAKRFGLDLQKFPNINSIYQRCMDLESCKSSKPEAYT